MNVREAIYGRRAVGEFSAEPACWIGFAQGWQGTSAGKSALKLPEADIPVAPIIIGHPKSIPPAVSRKPARIDWVS